MTDTASSLLSSPPPTVPASPLVGTALPDWTPPPSPDRKPLVGRTVTLEPLDPQQHGHELFAASHGPGTEHLWTYMTSGPFDSPVTMQAWLRRMADRPDPLLFAIRPTAGETRPPVQGMAGFLRMVPAMGTLEIGHIWFGPSLKRTQAATEAIALLMGEALGHLGYRRLEWKCDAMNAASRRAAERFGFTFEGLFRQHMVVKGHNRDTAWFSLLDSDWPRVETALRHWLDPANFDAQGCQITPLKARSHPSSERATASPF